MFYKCECCTHGLDVEVDKSNQVVQLAFWKYGHDNKWDWLNRLRYIWDLVRGRSPYADMILLDMDVARWLAHDLFKATELINHDTRSI